jgi:transposase InsO family protein
MSYSKHELGTRQERWARFRFSVIGALLASPPAGGELKAIFTTLAKKKWCHPITGADVYFGASTIERWFYQARKAKNPVAALRTKCRTDQGKTRDLSSTLKQVIEQQYREHPSWSFQLHFDNIQARVKQSPEVGSLPSYSTVRRYMKSRGMNKKTKVRKRYTEGAIAAAERLETREVRSFEVDHVHALWHLDFHESSFAIVGRNGQWYKPKLLAIMDDRSRLICHAQWYVDETAETLVHGFMQALQKRGLPRALMNDNGAAMISGEFTEGLARLSILHQFTLPYSPYANGKQEHLWTQLEGRLMAMLESETELTLAKLNYATLAWIEVEYHRKFHSEINTTPMDRFLNDPNVGRLCTYDSKQLREMFCIQVSRKQRHSDGTLSLAGKRFEVPSQYRHVEALTVRYARWDLSHVLLVDANQDMVLCMLHPQDKSANASGLRRAFKEIEVTPTIHEPIATAPLLKALMTEYAATGHPPAYIPKDEEK